MDKELRDKDLKSLGAHRRYGKALKDWMEEQIKLLENVQTIPDENFEVEGKAAKKAALTLRRLFRYLKKEEKVEKRKNQYK